MRNPAILAIPLLTLGSAPQALLAQPAGKQITGEERRQLSTCTCTCPDETLGKSVTMTLPFASDCSSYNGQRCTTRDGTQSAYVRCTQSDPYPMRERRDLPRVR
jgi:hypothetical protein